MTPADLPHHQSTPTAQENIRAVAQLSSVGDAWDARLQRIKRIAETIQRSEDDEDEGEA